ncbi:MAG: 2-C-methyl-D-erythritol 2,4-cyclodiphosphate synthase [Candidatus Sericytochromatia bacterium]|uniref:2-C-methyl-D-erythritol 2,4-cyclodiphosphate synthase n=1 Tax=Candidatus Tanganyikabacteria bacterium TaxID=2961651 RepID=A0A938BMS7_9BACT|nr:2-C-methyl-D-erythritol 2,4-cyclodiphosphate synthase [Candidatus Tanganyikabacteria bacterium]
MSKVRVGTGYDVHAFVAGRPLRLGGIDIPHDRGLAGDSDADVLTHAIIDALLGAAALGDLGTHFPPGDPRFKDARSLDLLETVLGRVRDQGWSIGNVDATVIAQEPRLAPHVPAMRRALARTFAVPEGDVAIKATTPDHLGALGRAEGIAAQAVVLLERNA